MRKKIPILFMFLIAAGMVGIAQVFYLATVQTDDLFFENALQLNFFLRNQYSNTQKIVLCTGETQTPTLFNVYSTVFSASEITPLQKLFQYLAIQAVFPKKKDFEYGLTLIKQTLPPSLPVINTDEDTISGVPVFFEKTISEARILFANISAIPSNWYERLRKEVNFLNYDAVILFMDEPDFRIVPESLRSKTVLLPRKTAIYRLDLEYGLLVTEIRLPQEKDYTGGLETIEADFRKWQSRIFPIDPQGKSFFVELPFYSMMGIMMKNLYPTDLILFFHKNLPLQATPEEAKNFFTDYAFGVLHLENAGIRKLLERSASTLDLENGQITVAASSEFYSLWGEAYYLDITKPKNERLILKTFDQTQKILFLGPSETLAASFPAMKFLPISPLPYLFWTMKYSEVALDPAWSVLTQPYFIDYTIRKGDTLISIAANFGISVEAIKKYNPGLIDMYLILGSVLKIHIPNTSTP